MSALAIELCERGWLPDALARLGMRRLMQQRLDDEQGPDPQRADERYRQLLAELRDSRIALETDAANVQHYEVPARFFELVLGRQLKYSGCYWPQGVDSLNAAEESMLSLTTQRAELQDGQQILELGCGWGSLTLWMARAFPASRITAVSNSSSQREFILQRCAAENITNVEVITADVNEFSTDQQFDRVVSVEMFEHMRNYHQLLANISGWLRPGGKLFVHIFCHRELMYPFETEGEDNWMGRYFFTGGLMPSVQTLEHFQEHLNIEERWMLNGRHYEQTANAWLRNLDDHRDALMEVFAITYGRDEAARWLQRWRMFFMAVAELFGYRDGEEWLVAHYRFCKPAE